MGSSRQTPTLMLLLRLAIPSIHSPKMEASVKCLHGRDVHSKVPDPAQREAQILQIQWAAMASLVRRCAVRDQLIGSAWETSCDYIGKGSLVHAQYLHYNLYCVLVLELSDRDSYSLLGHQLTD